MTKYRILLLLILIPLINWAQDDDFGIWYNAGASHKLSKNWKLEIDATVRTCNDASKVESAFAEGGVAYKFNKYISASGYYRLINNLEKDDDYHLRHRFYLDLRGKLPVGRFDFSTRLRFQRQYKTWTKDEDDEAVDYYARAKFMASYNIPQLPINPHVSFELFCPVFNKPSETIGKHRTAVGFEYKLSKKHSLDVEYIFQRDYMPHIADANILSLSYMFDF